MLPYKMSALSPLMVVYLRPLVCASRVPYHTYTYTYTHTYIHMHKDIHTATDSNATGRQLTNISTYIAQ